MRTVTFAPASSLTAVSVWSARNTAVLKLFGPVLVVTGTLGFVLPPEASLMSGAAPYNVFHIAFGLLGSALAWCFSGRHASKFNVLFGAIDLYQAVASFARLPPAAAFAYKTTDDVLHVLLGVALCSLGVLGLRERSAKS
jgi:hypothetical protein